MKESTLHSIIAGLLATIAFIIVFTLVFIVDEKIKELSHPITNEEVYKDAYYATPESTTTPTKILGYQPSFQIAEDTNSGIITNPDGSFSVVCNGKTLTNKQ